VFWIANSSHSRKAWPELSHGGITAAQGHLATATGHVELGWLQLTWPRTRKTPSFYSSKRRRESGVGKTWGAVAQRLRHNASGMNVFYDRRSALCCRYDAAVASTQHSGFGLSCAWSPAKMSHALCVSRHQNGPIRSFFKRSVGGCHCHIVLIALPRGYSWLPRAAAGAGEEGEQVGYAERSTIVCAFPPPPMCIQATLR
jgi:hypothetical protein